MLCHFRNKTKIIFSNNIKEKARKKMSEECPKIFYSYLFFIENLKLTNNDNNSLITIWYQRKFAKNMLCVIGNFSNTENSSNIQQPYNFSVQFKALLQEQARALENQTLFFWWINRNCSPKIFLIVQSSALSRKNIQTDINLTSIFHSISHLISFCLFDVKKCK